MRIDTARPPEPPSSARTALLQLINDLDEEAVRRHLAFVRAWLAGWQEPPRA